MKGALSLLLASSAALAAAVATAAPGDPIGPEGGRTRSGPADPAEALRRSRSLAGIHGLLPEASRMAREWSPGAVLYSALGRLPRNDRLLEPEEWSLIFGDPETRDGNFQVTFHNGVLHSRQGVQNSVKVAEFFREGKLAERLAGIVSWSSPDYDQCLPLARKFVDVRRIDQALREEELQPGPLDQFRFALLNPRTNHCDGLGHLSQFLTEKPVPRRLRSRTLWIVTGEEETLYFDGVRGRLLHRRSRIPGE